MFKDESLISVITPAFNVEKFIGKTIESVLCQTFQNWEMIIVDDSSTDNTVRIAQSYAEKDIRIKVIELGYNSGRPAVPRNYGIKHARGEFIAFLDSDDIWFPSKLDKQICHFQNKEIVAVSSQALLIRGPLISRKYFYRKNRYIDYGYRDFLFHNYAVCSSVIVYKDIVSELKGFDEREDFLFIEDWELWLRVARMGRIRVLEEPLLYYRIQSAKKRGAVEVSKKCFLVLEKHTHFQQISRRDIKEAKANINLFIAYNLLRLLDCESQEYFKKAIKYSSNLKTKFKAVIGYLLSILPTEILKILFVMFYSLRAFTYTNKSSKLESIWAFPKK